MKRVEFNLDSGHAAVFFETGKTADPAQLWKAVLNSGFTPLAVEIGDQAYRGPNKKEHE